MDESDRWWRAFRSRDARFDGRIFMGVTSTGIYCRPVCPARSPRRDRVRFFPSAAAAAAAGFRACRRCRPETAPGTPEWLGGSAVVARALRLIDGGFLDRHPVADLAGAVHVGERQLRRLFLTHVGAAPHLVARTRRAERARLLLDATDLPLVEVAAAAGYGSRRQFAAAMKATYGRSAGSLRRGRQPRTGIVLRLAYRPPLDWDAMLAYLAARAIPGVEAVEGTAYRRVARAGDAIGVVEVAPAPDRHALLVRATPSLLCDAAGVVRRVRDVFDLDCDPLAIAGALGGDPVLGRLLRRRPGLRIPGAWDGFEVAVRAILGQQVTVRGASALAGRLVQAHGEPLTEPDGALTHAFPRPAALVRDDLVEIGLPSAARGRAIAALAGACAAGLELGPAVDPDATRAALVALPGVGQWTADYVAMRALRDPDAFPAADLGLRRALAVDGRDASAREAQRRAEAWHPWRAYAALHLWQGLGDDAAAVAETAAVA